MNVKHCQYEQIKNVTLSLSFFGYFLTGGAAEFVSQASQGILQGAGLVRVPEKLFVVQKEMLQEIVGCESHMKLMW